MVVDPEKLRKYCAEFSNSHNKAIEVLRSADGKKDYKKIAKALKMNATIVSGLLKKAYNFGLAKKMPNSFYKKESGVMGYMPKIKNKNQVEIPGELKKLSKRKFKEINSFNGISLHTKNSSEMAKAYMWLYVVENTYRDFIRKVYEQEMDWWPKKVGNTIREEVEEAMEKYPYDAPERGDELEYTTLQQLKQIISNKKNWNDFVPYLNEKDRKKFGLKFEIAFPFRNATGHCIPMKSEDLKSVEIKFKDILKMLKN